MRNPQDAEHLAAIRTRTERVLREVIGESRDVAIVDAPNQRNVGDSLIWEGELVYLRRLGYTIRYVCDLNSYDPADVRRALPQGGTVLLHGGGNFGDLWVWHQRLREQVAADLTDYRVVQLSQSVFFSDEDRAAEANRVLGAHPDLHVLLRDPLSIERASRLLPDVTTVFCPDMALGWEPTAVPPEDGQAPEVLVIARADKESASGLREAASAWRLPLPVRVTDWGLHARDPLGWTIARALSRVNHRVIAARRKTGVRIPGLPQWALQRIILSVNRRNTDSALRLYAPAKAVVVDRLHAHVLSLLLGIPHVLLDNNYRKLGAVFDEYTGAFSTARYSLDVADAEHRIREVIGS